MDKSAAVFFDGTTMDLRAALNWGVSRLGGGEDSRRDAEILLGHAAGKKRFELYASSPEDVPRGVFGRYAGFIARRLEGVPADYITGRTEFFSLPFYVDEGVLVPRKETEILVEAALRRLGPGHRVMEIGTGSGNIAVALAKLSGCRVLASDVSARAVGLAKKNAALNGVSGLIDFLQGDMFEPVRQSSPRGFDMIVSNPPYVRADEFGSLQPEVSRCEPRTALDGGDDGLRFFRVLAEESPYFLNRGGVLIMEMGRGQSVAVGGLLEAGGFEVQLFRDYSGVLRVAEGVLH